MDINQLSERERQLLLSGLALMGEKKGVAPALTKDITALEKKLRVDFAHVVVISIP